jgi:hypothetical protein
MVMVVMKFSSGDDGVHRRLKDRVGSVVPNEGAAARNDQRKPGVDRTDDDTS